MSVMFSGPVVCDAGPIIGLGRVGLESLPFDLFPRVLVPEEVERELLGEDSPDADRIGRALSKGEIVSLEEEADPFLSAELDPGEAAVIAVAMERGISGVVIDDRKGRRVASTVYGLRVKGAAGLLVEAKRRGLVGQVGPLLEGMKEGGYFLSPGIMDACLRAAGEL